MEFPDRFSLLVMRKIFSVLVHPACCVLTCFKSHQARETKIAIHLFNNNFRSKQEEDSQIVCGKA